MTKPESLHVVGCDFFLWPYEEQTKMKHKVLAEYFKIWATMLGKYNPVMFFDCHGGCGAYWDETNKSVSWGSSVLVAQKTAELKAEQDRVVYIFVAEKERENADNLRKVIDSLNLPVVPSVAIGDFATLIARPKIQMKYQNYPALFFVDPFGYTLRYEDLGLMMRFPKNEMIVNFMFNYINRFISYPNQTENFNQFFGCEEWKEAIPLSGFDREKKLVEVYRKQLKKYAKYVFAYRFSVYDKNRTYYYLFHATNHIDGCSIMKSVFASQNCGRVEYLGNRTGMFTLFDLNEVRNDEVQQFLIGRFSGTTVTFGRIVDAIIEETFYLEKDIRAALRELRKTGAITITPVTSKKNGIAGEDVITFMRN